MFPWDCSGREKDRGAGGEGRGGTVVSMDDELINTRKKNKKKKLSSRVATRKGVTQRLNTGSGAFLPSTTPAMGPKVVTDSSGSCPWVAAAVSGRDTWRDLYPGLWPSPEWRISHTGIH